jgi:hypothetical protein
LSGFWSARPESAADRSGTLLTGQEDRVALWTGVALLVGWAALASASGGFDIGRPPFGRGAAAAWAAVVVLAAALVVALAQPRRGAPAIGAPALLALGGMGGLTAWTGASIAWARAPDLAWIEANRTALALAALALGLVLARRLADPGARVAVGIALATTPVLAWGLGNRILPDLLARPTDRARLDVPLGLPNATALVAAMAVPGALVLATGRRRVADAAVALIAAALLTAALTGSRSGAIALAAALVPTIWGVRSRQRAVGALLAGILAAAPGIAYGLTAGPLTGSPLPDVAGRRGAGLALGALLVAGIVAGILARPALVRWSVRVGRRTSGQVHIGLVVAIVGALVIVAGAAVVVTRSGGASNEPGTRLTQAEANHRLDWWEEALDGFADAPLRGNGAGSFRFVELVHRDTGADALTTTEPHQLELQLLTELGIVGLALALAAIAGIGWAAWRAGRSAGPVLAVFVAFLVQAQLDVPWSLPALVVAAFAAAGAVLALGGIRAASGARPAAAQAAVVAVSVLALAAVASATTVWLAERKMDQAATLLDVQGRTEAALGPAGRAADINRLAATPLILSARARLALGDRPAAAALARRATGRQPDNPFAWECLAAAGQADAAAALARAVALNPRRDPGQPPACRPAG